MNNATAPHVIDAFSFARIASTLALLTGVGSASAGATTDGSVGAIQTLSGHFTIPQSLGTVSGANLFHSFARFGIDAAECATFTTTTRSIQNVISRVTGGEPSAIHGALRLQAVSGSHPDFYLVNPAGVVFGAGAEIDVPASFHVSTAQRLRFADGFVWDTSSASHSGLTVAAPESFGFVGGGRPAPVIFNNLAADGSTGAPLTLRLEPGASFKVTAGDVGLDAARVSVSEGGQIKVDAAGDISLRNGGRLESATASNKQAGSISLTGASLLIENGGNENGVQSTTAGAGDAADVSVRVAGAITLLRSDIASQTTATGSAGFIDIEARSMLIDGHGRAHGVFDSALRGASGPINSGNIRMRVAGELRLTDGGQISSSTNSRKPAGSVEIEAGSVAIGKAARQDTGIYSIAGKHSSSDAGDIRINVAGDLSISGGGEVSASTVSGNAGSIEIEAQSIDVDHGSISSAAGAGSQGNSGAIVINARSINVEQGSISGAAGADSQGNGGAIVINAKEALALTNGGRVVSNTASVGQAGSITIEAGTMTIDREGTKVDTGVFSNALATSSGDAGEVKIHVRDHFVIRSEGRVSSEARSSGSSGAIDVQARSLTIDREGASLLTGIFTESLRTSSGTNNHGHIRVKTAEALELLNGGQISASTFSDKPGGSVVVEAGSLVIDRAGKQTTGIFSLAGDRSHSDAGNIEIDVVGKASIMRGGEISSGTRSGRGGQIQLQVGSLVLDGGGSHVASTASPQSSGHPGSVTVLAQDSVTLRNGGKLSIGNDALVSPESLASRRAEAAAQATVRPSKIRVSAPRIDLSGGAEITAASTGNVAASEVFISASESLSLRNASISTTARDGNGGDISLSGGHLLRLDHSQVSTSVLGAQNGSGGDISVRADTLVLQTGSIQANTAAAQAAGGKVDVEVGQLITNGALLLGGQAPIAFDPTMAGINVIQAAAPDGVSGNVTVSSPIVDIAGDLHALSSDVIDYGALGRDRCRVGLGSSFTPVGRGGLRVSSRGWIRDEGKVERLTQAHDTARYASASPSLRAETSCILQ